MSSRMRVVEIVGVTAGFVAAAAAFIQGEIAIGSLFVVVPVYPDRMAGASMSPVDLSSSERLWLAREALDHARAHLVEAIEHLDTTEAAEAAHGARFAVLQVEETGDALREAASK